MLGPEPILSIVEYKTSTLRVVLSLIGIGAGTAYLFIDRFNGIYGNDIYYLAVVTSGMLTIYLNRLRYYKMASIIYMVTLNTVIFLFTDNDSYYTGVYIFYICTGLTGFALFGRQHIYFAMGFVILAIGLFLLAYWNEGSIIERPDLPPALIKNYLTINFIVAIIICTSIIYFLISINFHTEKQLLEQNKLLAKANAELDQFAYSVSHDLRAPLSSVQGIINLYKHTDNQAEKEEMVAKIDGRVKTLDLFIRKILDHSRNSRMDIFYENVYPAQLVKEIVGELDHMRDFGKQEIKIDIPDHLMIVTDKSRLRIILSNLLSNAIKYYDPQKVNAYIRIEALVADEYWKLIVSDNGIGIEESQLSKIFNMFHRANDRSEGSGLGLYIVEEVCKKLAGSITVTSKSGEGSRFEMTFPVVQQVAT